MQSRFTVNFIAALAFTATLAAAIASCSVGGTSTPAPTTTRAAQIPPSPSPSLTATPSQTKTPTVTATPSSTPVLPTVTPLPEGWSRPSYTLHANLDYVGHEIEANERLAWVNRTGHTLKEIVLNVYANHQDGLFSLQDLIVSLDGRPLPTEHALEGTILHVRLSEELKPEKRIVLNLRFTVNLPQGQPNDAWWSFIDLSWSDKGLVAGHWYPVLAAYRSDQGWQGIRYHDVGDPFVAEVADYELEVRAPDGVIVAAPGELNRQGNLWRYQMERARSFPIVASDGFSSATQNVGDTAVTSFYYPEDEESGKAVLEIAAAAVQLFNQLYGDYPYPTFRIVQADFWSGMEYSGLILLGTSRYREYNGTPRDTLPTLVVHEVAHQWWYSIVGSDQVNEPWLDEALVKFSEVLFYEAQYPGDVSWWWEDRIGKWDPQGWVDGGIYEYTDHQSYVNAVYRRGAQFMAELRDNLGDDALFDFLQAYFEEWSFKIATGKDFFIALLDFTKDLDILTRRGKYFKDPLALILGEEATIGGRQLNDPLLHPLALAIADETGYLVDEGMLKTISLARDPATIQILEPTNRLIEDIPIKELLDLALVPDGKSLLLLDRSGDIYRYHQENGAWEIERSAAAEGSSAYYTSLATVGGSAYLLDTARGQMRESGPGGETARLQFPAERGIGLAADSDSLYVLLRETTAGSAELRKYSRATGQRDPQFVPPEMEAPVAVISDLSEEGMLYVVDRRRKRLSGLDKDSGHLSVTLALAPEDQSYGGVWAEDGRLYIVTRNFLARFPGKGAELPAVGRSSYVEHLEARLSDMTMPVEGAHVPVRERHLPGAPRRYRFGVHEGTDFYGWAVGATVNRNTRIRAAADGTVIRADPSFQPLDAVEMQTLLQRAQEAGHTPPDVLDRLRGRQVWVEHIRSESSSVVTRYVHLDVVAEGIAPDVEVEAGQVLGYSGNSGTPESLQGPDAGVHLHFEIWVDGRYVGEHLAPAETRRLLREILGLNN